MRHGSATMTYRVDSAGVNQGRVNLVGEDPDGNGPAIAVVPLRSIAWWEEAQDGRVVTLFLSYGDSIEVKLPDVDDGQGFRDELWAAFKSTGVEWWVSS